MKNTKLAAHPFAQIASTDMAQVSGGTLDFKQVTMKYPEDGISNLLEESGDLTKIAGEDGTGPIFTTQAIGEEGGHDLPELM